ncbi:MAG: transketolase, partial [Planctomycetes bacterium]|nr:transketolase [Planctomycetota bacterium]
DSIGVGEDGPTHQPVEHLASLRVIPNLVVIRPADANETAQAWKYIVENRDRPIAIALTRQGLPVLDQEKYPSAANLAKGGYVLVKPKKPDLLLIATGSEVKLAIEAAQALAEEGIAAQVVSLPSWELFDEQDDKYKNSVLPPKIRARIGIEAGVRQGWDRYLGDNGVFIGMTSFGASGPGQKCFEKFGITTENIVKAAKKTI